MVRTNIFTAFLPVLRYGSVICCCVALFSCGNKKDREFRSAEMTMGNGKVFSWIITDYTGKPKSLGFTLNASALDGLPVHGPGHEHHNEFELPLLPWAASKTPFNHIVINWNPDGHIPNPPYGLPHFDFHFYMITSSERMSIGTWSTDSVRQGKLPSLDYLPPHYINPPGSIASDAEMGNHWIDTLSPEVAKTGPFTYHFVYGTYNGRVNFIEPMITMDYFRSITDFDGPVPRPAKVDRSGYYPTTIHIYQKDGNYIMSLGDMEYRNSE